MTRQEKPTRCRTTRKNLHRRTLAIVSLESKCGMRDSRMSEETSSLRNTPDPLHCGRRRFLHRAFTSSSSPALQHRNESVIEASGVGTRSENPSSFPSASGMTLPTVLARQAPSWSE